MMICKHCGKETANVLCDNCGMNVIWYNKWGIKHDEENPGELAQYDIFIPQDDSDIEQDLIDFVPDGSGD